MASRRARDGRQHREERARRAGTRRADSVGLRRSRAGAGGQDRSRPTPRWRRRMRRWRKAKPLSRNKYKITLTKAAVKRAILNAANGRVRRCRMMLMPDQERFDTSLRNSVHRPALEAAVHRRGPRPHGASDQRRPVLVHPHPDLHRPRRPVGRARHLLVNRAQVPRNREVWVSD